VSVFVLNAILTHFLTHTVAASKTAYSKGDRVNNLTAVDTMLVGNKQVEIEPLVAEQPLAGLFRGQQTTFAESISMAVIRNQFDEFVIAPSTTTRCDYCAMQVCVRVGCWSSFIS